MAQRTALSGKTRAVMIELKSESEKSDSRCRCEEVLETH